MWQLIVGFVDQVLGVSPEAWALVGTSAGAFVASFFVARKGMRKSPVEVGSAPPPTDLLPYVQQDVRTLARNVELLTDQVRDHHDENGRALDAISRDLARIYLDTQVLRERGNR